MFFKRLNWTSVEKFSGVIFFSFVGLWFFTSLETWNSLLCYEIWLHFYIYIGSEPWLTLLDMAEHSKRSSRSLSLLDLVILVFISLTSALLCDLLTFYFKLSERGHPCVQFISLDSEFCFWEVLSPWTKNIHLGKWTV